MTLTDILREKYGQSYIDLMSREAPHHETRIRVHKCEIIDRIMKLRNEMGYEPEAKLFDKLYDMSLADLMGQEVQYTDLKHNHEKKNRTSNA